MATDVFTVLAEPMRRRILDELRMSERTVGQLLDRLRISDPGISQPTVSKHLAVLRAAGLVLRRSEAQNRWYQIDDAGFVELESWLAPYRAVWNQHLDELERHLDRVHPMPGTPAHSDSRTLTRKRSSS